MINKEIAKNKVFLRTFGCQMNIRDSEFVMGLMLEKGFAQAASIDDADIILFNSCSVRKHAEDRLISNIADLKLLKKKKPHLVIGLIGCTAQSYKEGIIKKLPIVDISCGPGNETDLPDMVRDVLTNRCKIIAVDKTDQKKPELFPKYREQKYKAYVSIGEGCDNYCSYCIVPYVRGRERSRDMKDILKEVRALAAGGFKEVILLGQNVNSYQSDNKNGFIRLLEEVDKVKGIERIRFMTSHPKDVSVDLFKAMRDLEKVCEHLHLPLQSGADRILALMNRRYTRKKYMKLASEYKHLNPRGSITTDIIVGFPTETEEDFKNTMDLVEEVAFDGAFTFKYSPRPPARSAEIPDDVPADEKARRLKILIDTQCEISRRRNEPFNGTIVEVLVEGLHEKDRTLATGRERTNKTVIFKAGKDVIGRIVKVKIGAVKPHTLIGEMVL